MSVECLVLLVNLILSQFLSRINGTKEQSNEALLEDATAFLILNTIISIIHFLFACITIDLANYAAIKQITTIRKLFVNAVLRQDMSWYDTISDKNFAVKMTEQVSMTL